MAAERGIISTNCRRRFFIYIVEVVEVIVEVVEVIVEVMVQCTMRKLKNGVKSGQL